jgi:hypothetical protein
MTEWLKWAKENREAILLLEAAGLLHDLGKLSDGFLHSQAKDQGLDYEYKLLANPNVIYPAATPVGDAATDAVAEWQTAASDPNVGAPFKDRQDLTNLLQTIVLTAWDGQSYSLAELMALTMPRHLASSWLALLGKNMQPALLIAKLHGVAHYEKEEAPEDNKQLHAKMHAATPFGSESPIAVGALTGALQALPLDRLSEVVTDLRQDWLQKMQGLVKRGIADTRRPTNEVSLWDWGYTVASLTKAAAAWIYKNGWPADLNDLTWRTLCVNLNTVDLYARTDKISDLLGLRATLDQSFKQVQTLLEVEIPVANLFYQDETGLYFLYPDFPIDQELRDAIQKAFPPDLWPQVHLGKPVSAGQLDGKSPGYDPDALKELVAEPRRQALARRATPVLRDDNLYTWKDEWTEGRPSNAEICTVCGLRPVGYPRKGSSADAVLRLEPWATQDKAERRNICRVCLDRRGRRAESWASEGLAGTIWTDEVADDHGRLALIAGRLDLDGWLDGNLLATIPVTRKRPKNPSPARLYRIAETTWAFWQQVIANTIPETIDQRPYRLALHPADNDLPALRSQLDPFHAYELEVDGLSLGVLWDEPNARFLSAENLAYFVRRWGRSAEELQGHLAGRKLVVLEPSAYGHASQELANPLISNVVQLEGYEPAIPLISEPEVFMSLVPADKALKLVQEIRHRYKGEFGRVRDRLPIYLGLVFFLRRTPIRARRVGVGGVGGHWS